MKMPNGKTSRLLKPVLMAAVLAMTGCAALKDHVFVNTETVLGISICQSAASGSPEARLGYARVEIALAPTNSEVLTEFQFKNAFSFTAGPGLYQRMAIGKDAVEQSWPMFCKDNNGNMPTNIAAIYQSIKSPK
jgi:hypothetical protein